MCAIGPPKLVRPNLRKTANTSTAARRWDNRDEVIPVLMMLRRIGKRLLGAVLLQATGEG
ncbi:protein of unknown function (plasmid) [Pararobbsia alpina]